MRSAPRSRGSSTVPLTMRSRFSPSSLPTPSCALRAVDNFRIGGKDVTLHWSSVWELDPAGKITTQRDYWDAKELAAQLA
jgi:hypothetical protein